MAADQAKAIIWWAGDPIKDLVEQIEAKGGPDAVRLEFHLSDRLLYVRPQGAALASSHEDDDDGINFSHQCPPECPEG